MLGALIRRRGRLLAAIAAILVVVVGAAVVAFGRSADVVVYNGRSQYGDETVFTAWEKQTSKSRRQRARAVRAPPQRGVRDPRRPARDHRPREPLAREGGGHARVGLDPGAGAPGARGLPRPGRPVVGAEPADPDADALHGARRGG